MSSRCGMAQGASCSTAWQWCHNKVPGALLQCTTDSLLHLHAVAQPCQQPDPTLVTCMVGCPPPHRTLLALCTHHQCLQPQMLGVMLDLAGSSDRQAHHVHSLGHLCLHNNREFMLATLQPSCLLQYVTQCRRSNHCIRKANYSLAGLCVKTDSSSADCCAGVRFCFVTVSCGKLCLPLFSGLGVMQFPLWWSADTHLQAVPDPALLQL